MVMKFFIKMAFLVIITSASSCKKESYSNATVIKNCTGTYLRVLDKEYKVCNSKKIANFEDQQKVLANFSLTKECKSENFLGGICSMAYPFDGLINVIDIKKL